MPLPAPQIDDRPYRQILNEALARVRVHNPEWTNFNESDPGVTLLQLFAFMAESIHYRANLIPDRNRQKFLRLLHIPLVPPAAATGVVAFTNERGPLATTTLPAGMAVLAGTTEYRTQTALDVLPVEARIFVKHKVDATAMGEALETYAELYAVEADEIGPLAFYETTPVEPPTSAADITPFNVSDETVDETLWIALVARAGDDRPDVRGQIAGKTISLGLMPWIDERTRPAVTGERDEAGDGTSLVFEVATGKMTGEDSPIPSYTRLDVRADADPRRGLTLFQITLPGSSGLGVWENLGPGDDGSDDFPPSLEDDDVATRVVTWLRIGPASTTITDGATDGLDFKFSWIGVNAARVQQRSNVVGEQVGVGTGEPDQVYTVANRPVIVDTVELSVSGETWMRTDDLLAAAPEVPVRNPALPPGTNGTSTADPSVTGLGVTKVGPPGESAPQQARVFGIDRESGEIRFGDGLRGARPRGPIVVNYGYGGGAVGNVGIGAIKTAPQLPAGFKARNPLPTWGGTEGEAIADAERNIPLVLRHRDRAVSKEDFRDIVLRTPGIELGRVDVLPLFSSESMDDNSPGVVTVMVLPRDPLDTGAPAPDHVFLKAVCSYLAPRRVLTSEIYVEGPTYVPIAVSVGFEAIPGADIATVREGIKAAIRTFVSPLRGGFQQEGWPIGKAVVDRELWAQATRVDGVATLRDLSMWRIDTDGFQRVSEVPLEGLELPKLQQIAVTVDGDPEDLSVGLVREPPGSIGGTETEKRVPVPVLPTEC